MDNLIQTYMEETEEMLQRAEECVIRLEMDYSSADVNELFRIAHTIKGSSHMVGYEDIGNLMHRVEDMLDCARNGSISFVQSMVSLCFEGLDTVKKMLQYKKNPGPKEITDNLLNASFGISKSVEDYIRANKMEEEKHTAIQTELGYVSSLINEKSKGENKYFITFHIDEDAPMISPVFIIILNQVAEMGTLSYASVSDNYFSGHPNVNENKRTLDIIMCTDFDENELYTYFSLCYVEKISITDLAKNVLDESQFSYNDTDEIAYVVIIRAFFKLYNVFSCNPTEFVPKSDELRAIETYCKEAENAFGKVNNKNKIVSYYEDFNRLYNLIIKLYNGQIDAEQELWERCKTQMVELIERTYNKSKGKYVFSAFRAKEGTFIDSLRKFIEMINTASTIMLIIDISDLNILHCDEVKKLMEMKKQLEDQNVAISIIAQGTGARRVTNIFDSIKSVDNFMVFASQLDAVLYMFQSEDSFRKISSKIKKAEHDDRKACTENTAP